MGPPETSETFWDWATRVLLPWLRFGIFVVAGAFGFGWWLCSLLHTAERGQVVPVEIVDRDGRSLELRPVIVPEE